MTRILMILIIALICCVVQNNIALAMGNFVFGSKIGSTSKVLLNHYLSEEYETSIQDYDIASQDLNGDGIDEFILKPENCISKNNQCIFLILAETRQKIVVLGKIQAKILALGNDYSNGIQDILAFRDNNNDYNYEVYSWDSTSKKYILKGQTVTN